MKKTISLPEFLKPSPSGKCKLNPLFKDKFINFDTQSFSSLLSTINVIKLLKPNKHPRASTNNLQINFETLAPLTKPMVDHFVLDLTNFSDVNISYPSYSRKYVNYLSENLETLEIKANHLSFPYSTIPCYFWWNVKNATISGIDRNGSLQWPKLENLTFLPASTDSTKSIEYHLIPNSQYSENPLLVDLSHYNEISFNLPNLSSSLVIKPHIFQPNTVWKVFNCFYKNEPQANKLLNLNPAMNTEDGLSHMLIMTEASYNMIIHAAKLKVKGSTKVLELPNQMIDHTFVPSKYHQKTISQLFGCQSNDIINLDIRKIWCKLFEQTNWKNKSSFAYHYNNQIYKIFSKDIKQNKDSKELSKFAFSQMIKQACEDYLSELYSKQKTKNFNKSLIK